MKKKKYALPWVMIPSWFATVPGLDLGTSMVAGALLSYSRSTHAKVYPNYEYLCKLVYPRSGHLDSTMVGRLETMVERAVQLGLLCYQPGLGYSCGILGEPFERGMYPVEYWRDLDAYTIRQAEELSQLATSETSGYF